MPLNTFGRLLYAAGLAVDYLGVSDIVVCVTWIKGSELSCQDLLRHGIFESC